jgi:hypothetical protein
VRRDARDIASERSAAKSPSGIKRMTVARIPSIGNERTPRSSRCG